MAKQTKQQFAKRAPAEAPATAVAPAPASALGFDEIGTTGLKRWGGQVDEELLADLRGKKAVKIYQQMSEYDDIVGACLFAMTTFLKKASFEWKSASDSAEDKAIHQFFVETWGDMSLPWEDILSDILTMFTYGWTVMEIVLKQRKGDTGEASTQSRYDDGKIGIGKLAIRAQETLDRWEFDPKSGDPIAMVQQDPVSAKGPVTIPLAKCLLFRTSTVKNNPEGRSLLKNAYQSWYFKTNIRSIEGIGIERDLAGYPYIQTEAGAPDLWNPKDTRAATSMQAMQQMIQGIRRDENEGAIMPPWAKLQLLSSGSKRNFDTGAVITRYDQRMAMSMMADFILVGHDASGSKALSKTKLSAFTSALSGFGQAVTNVINRFLVPPLMTLNGWGKNVPPQFVVSNIVDVDIADVAALLRELTGGGAVLFPDRELEDSLLKMVQLRRGEHPEHEDMVDEPVDDLDPDVEDDDPTDPEDDPEDATEKPATPPKAKPKPKAKPAGKPAANPRPRS